MPAARVSQNMKRVGVVAAVALAGGALWYLQRSGSTPAAAADDPLPPTLAASPSAATSSARAQRIDKVTRLASAEQRKQLADRIANAQTARAATHAAPVPRLPDQADEDTGTTLTKTEIRDAMREVVPLLAQCYEEALPKLANPDLSVIANLTLAGDPDIGTIVDAHELVDRDGNPMLPSFNDCIRSNLQLMALPPLAEGDKIEVRYPFEFRTK